MPKVVVELPKLPCRYWKPIVPPGNHDAPIPRTGTLTNGMLTSAPTSDPVNVLDVVSADDPRPLLPQAPVAVQFNVVLTFWNPMPPLKAISIGAWKGYTTIPILPRMPYSL